jgi:hypothetical protein
MKLVYSDQNNNVYVVSSDALSYDPITERESSSGVYSGGEAFRVSLEPSEYEEIINLAQKIANNPEGKSNKREMLTSVLTLVDDRKESAFILRRSEMRTELESLLQKHKE